MHRNHPAAGDPESAILYDNCGRCSELAARPYLLDNSRLYGAELIVQCDFDKSLARRFFVF